MNYVIFFMIVFLVMMFLKAKIQVDQVNKLNKMLFIKKEPHKYVQEFDKIFEKKQSPKNVVINVIQKTTGLFYMGRFDEVIQILKNDINRVPNNWAPIYHQNIILSLLFMGELEKAEESLEKARPVFDEFIQNDYYKELIEIVLNIYDYYKGEKSKEYFAELSKNGANDYRKSFGYYFQGMINKSENNMSEAMANFKRAAECGKGSFIEELSNGNN